MSLNEKASELYKKMNGVDIVSDIEVQSVIDETVSRIRRAKVDEAKEYIPTDEELITKIQTKIDSLENVCE